MNYTCSISFKKISPEYIFDFFGDLKEEAGKHFEDIAVENWFYSPLQKKGYTVYKDNKELAEKEGYNSVWTMREEVNNWAKESLFKYRTFYIKELGLLGVYGVPESLEPMFDGTVYFQNSCDKDYEKFEWDGIKEFEDIYDKYQNMPEEEYLKFFESAKKESWQNYHDLDDRATEAKREELLNYDRRRSAYEEIWGYCEDSLFNDRRASYVALYGTYDTDLIGFADIVYNVYCSVYTCYK